MKILCVIPSYFPAFKYGGPIASVHNLNKSLVKKGIEVAVFTTNTGLDRKKFTARGVDVDGVKVFYFDFSRFFEFLGPTGWQFSRPMALALKNRLKEFDLVYISAVWNYPTAIAAHYCRKFKKPYIIASRGALYPFTIRRKAWKKWLYYKLIARRDLKNADAIHYTAQEELEKCHSFLGLKNRAFVIPNIIDFSEYGNDSFKSQFKKNHPALADKKIVLFLGRINEIKGLDTLIGAFSLVIEEKPEAMLVIAGGDEGGYKKRVEEMIEKHNLREKVIFTGMLVGEEKIAAFKDSNVFVLPSYSESFGMAAFEAMHFGAPVIVTKGVGTAYVIESANAGLVVEKESSELSRAILRILTDGNLAEKLKENGKRLVEAEFSGAAVADKFIRACNDIINSKK